MAIKVQGTTVIDDSRNLQNVPNVNLTGNVYANTFIGDSSNLVNLPASGGSITATASGTLANGNKVIVNSDGTVSVVSGQDQGLGTETAYQSSGDVDGHRVVLARAAGDSTDRVVVAYRDHEQSYIVVGNISGTNISFGSSYQWHNANYRADPYVLLYDSNAETVVMIYAVNTGYDYAYARVFSINSTSVAHIGSAVQIDNDARGMANSTDKITAVYSESSNKSHVIWSYTGGSGFMYYKSITCGGTNNVEATLGSRGTVQTNQSVEYMTSCIDNTNHKIFLSYRGDVSNRARVLIPSGDSLTVGSATTFNVPNSVHRGSVFDPVSGKAVLLVIGAENGASYTNLYGLTADMGTGSSTSITFGTEQVLVEDASRYWFYSGTHTVDPSTGLITVVTKNDSSAYIFHLITFKVDGSSLTTPTSPFLLSDSGSFYPNLASVPAQDKSVLVYRHVTDGGKGYGRIFSPLSTNLTTENFIGISDGSYANGASATVQTKGSVDDAQSSLTIGKKYYVLPDGTLSTTASTNVPVFAGTAIASNKLIVKG